MSLSTIKPKEKLNLLLAAMCPDAVPDTTAFIYSIEMHAAGELVELSGTCSMTTTAADAVRKKPTLWNRVTHHNVLNIEVRFFDTKEWVNSTNTIEGIARRAIPGTTADDLLARAKIHKLLTMLYGAWLRNNVATLLYDTYADEASKQQNVAVATADCLAWQKVEARSAVSYDAAITDARARVLPSQARARDNSVTVETYLKELALCRTATGECPNFDKFQKMFGGGGGAAAAVGGGGAAAAAATG